MDIKELRKKLKSLKPHYIVLFITDPKEYHETNKMILKLLVNHERMSGIYITVNKPFSTLYQELKNDGINVDNIFFIDCITKTAGGKPNITENCLFMTSPRNLTELAIALTQAINSMRGSGDRFLFLDSLSTLLIYNTSDTIAQFSHFLVTRIRLCGLKGIFISVKRDVDEKLLATLSEFVDEVIYV